MLEWASSPNHYFAKADMMRCECEALHWPVSSFPALQYVNQYINNSEAWILK